MAHHRFEQHLHPIDIVVEVEQRFLHTLTDERVRRKVNNRVNLIFCKNPIKCRGAAYIALIETCLRMQCAAVPCLQIIDNGDLFTLLDECIDGVRSDVACPAANQNSHGTAPFHSIVAWIPFRGKMKSKFLKQKVPRHRKQGTSSLFQRICMRCACARRRAMRSAVAGWVENRLLNEMSRPVRGLMMHMCAVAGVASGRDAPCSA